MMYVHSKLDVRFSPMPTTGISGWLMQEGLRGRSLRQRSRALFGAEGSFHPEQTSETRHLTELSWIPTQPGKSQHEGSMPVV